MTVVLGRDATDDLLAAHDHYRSIESSVADGFRDAFEQAVERLEMFPRSGMPVAGLSEVRRARLRRYPYGIFYRLTDGDDVRILRVLHERRDHLAAVTDAPDA